MPTTSSLLTRGLGSSPYRPLTRGLGGAPVTLVSVAVTPATPTVNAGTNLQLTATGTYSDSGTADLTSSATWTSAATGTASVSASGLVTGVAAGTATVTATYLGVAGTDLVTVTVPTAAAGGAAAMLLTVF